MFKAVSDSGINGHYFPRRSVVHVGLLCVQGLEKHRENTQGDSLLQGTLGSGGVLELLTTSQEESAEAGAM